MRVWLFDAAFLASSSISEYRISKKKKKMISQKVNKWDFVQIWLPFGFPEPDVCIPKMMTDIITVNWYVTYYSVFLFFLTMQ